MHGAGNYSLTELDGNVVYKMRGHKLDTQHFSPSGTPVEAPGRVLLDALRANSSSSSFSTSSKHIKIASLGDFKTKANAGYLPGDIIVHQTQPQSRPPLFATQTKPCGISGNDATSPTPRNTG